MKRLIILDRDGVINYDSKAFIKSPDEWIAIPGSLDAIVKLNQAGFVVCIATNQSGVGRGLFTLETLDKIHEKMLAQLTALGGHIDEIVFCPHTPEDNCPCRKPKPEMITRLLTQSKILPENTWVIGDAYRDLEAGQAARCHTLLVKTGKGKETLREHPELKHVCFADLNQAVEHLLSTQGER